MANVYSQLLWAARTVISGSNTSGLVPAGFVWVVRSVSVTPVGQTWQACPSWELADSSGTLLAAGAAGFGVMNQTQTFDMHQVVNPGDHIALSVSSADAHIRVSGYQLGLP